HHRDVETKTGQRVAGARAASDICRARPQHSSFGCVCAASAELHHGTVARRFCAARGLGGDQGLKREGGEKIRLRDLGLDDGGAKRERGLAGEQRGAFRDCEKVARETEIFQVSKEAGGNITELGKGAKVVDFLRGETEI